MLRTNFVRPGVEIQQDFASVIPVISVPDLPTVIVGPNYQVVDDAPSGPAGAYIGGELTQSYPDLENLAVVEQRSVAVKLSSIQVQIYPPTLAGVSAAGTVTGTILTVADGGFVAAGVKGDTSLTVQDGDVIELTIASAVHRHRVVSRTSATVLVLNGAPAVGTAVAVTAIRIRRAVSPVTLTYELTAAQYALLSDTAKASYALVDGVYRHASLTVTDDEIAIAADLTIGEEPVSNATVAVSYRALRQLTANQITIINLGSEVATKLGVIDPRNPLALGTSIAKANTTTSVLAMGLASDDIAGWMAALDFLEGEAVYSICALTQDIAVHSYLHDQITRLSQPEKSKFRIGWLNLPEPVERNVVAKLSGGHLMRDNDVLTIMHPAAAFTGVVLSGQFVRVTGSNHDAVYQVDHVENDTTLVLSDRQYSGGNGVYVAGTLLAADFAVETADLEIIAVLDKLGQATAIATIAANLGDRRLMYVTNDRCIVNLGSVPIPVRHTVPGYYLAAAFAGMCAGFPPHQGFTNLGIMGIESVLYGNRYFSEPQLALIAGNGGLVVMQDSDTGLPYAYIQTTTDTSTPAKRELSVTRALDYYSFMLKAALMSYIGPYNIVTGTLVALQNSIEAVHSRLLRMKYDRIGTPILSGKIVTLRQTADEPDAVTLVCEVEVPMPLNRIRATIEVTGSVQ